MIWKVLAVYGMSNQTPVESYRSRAIAGLAWSSGVSIGLKVAGLLSQLALGWWLSENDFAAYALVISVSSTFSAVRNGGAQRILIQRGAEYSRLASPLFRFGLVFNLAIFLGIALSASAVAKFYAMEELATLLLITGATTLASTPGTVLSSKLSIDLNFKALSQIQLISGIVRVAATLLFARFGFGAYSFVWPPLIATLLELGLYLRYCGIWPKGAALSKQVIVEILPVSGFLAFGAICISIILQGDYLIVGAYETKSVLASYFFGFQLVGSFSALITGSFASVLTPTFAKLSNDKQKLGNAYRQSLIAAAAVTSPFFIALSLMSAPAIHVLWAGKWDSSIIVAQLIAASGSIRLVTAMPVYLLEAMGKWRLWAFVLAVDALGTLCAAYIGVQIGALIAVTVSVCLFRVAYSCWIAIVGYRICKIPYSNLFIDILVPFGTAISTAVPFFVLQQTCHIRGLLFAIVVGYLVVYVLLLRALSPHSLHSVVNFMPAIAKKWFIKVMRL